MWRVALTVVIVIVPQVLLAQTSPPTGTAGVDLSHLATVEAYVKVGGAALAAVIAVIGLPIIFLSYKKTRAEVIKLELETESLRLKMRESSEPSSPTDPDGAQQVNVKGAKNVSVQVLADPKLLNPLLLILNFAVAFAFLTLVSHILAIFDLGGGLVTAMLAGIVLLPLVNRALQVSSTFKSSISMEEVALYDASIIRIRIALLFSVLISAVASIAVGAYFVSGYSGRELDGGQKILAWLVLGGGIFALLASRQLWNAIKRFLPQL